VKNPVLDPSQRFPFVLALPRGSCKAARPLAGMCKQLSSAPRAGLLWVEGNASADGPVVCHLSGATAKLLRQRSLLQTDGRGSLL